MISLACRGRKFEDADEAPFGDYTTSPKRREGEISLDENFEFDLLFDTREGMEEVNGFPIARKSWHRTGRLQVSAISESESGISAGSLRWTTSINSHA